MGTKEKILQEALCQFNTLGVELVTTRHIAHALSISQGNLHYHYPSRNALIEALFNQFAQVSREGDEKDIDPLDHREVLISVRDAFDRMYAYRFLFKDNEVVWRRLPEMREKMIEIFNRLQDRIDRLIESYQKAGYISEQTTDAQLYNLAEQFVFTATTWLNASEYRSRPRRGMTEADHYARFAFRIWLPYLNQEQQQALQEVLDR
ncbi:TetR family transcriptional regulator [bacterium SCSIO 12741]|nr:TetR family transcriptional regulator [bacterium SCSIO 12741]